ncbi:phosphoribosyltransferase family protein [Flammeovirgaceae bacterium SG7u.111]|nr:phosphoribosyltransferase family protein [Flammeovirgaceae bacterium SG7u.132]WPO34693.1 phosphoribosyltransferase family protein [Flammeovirgaceae bacterium SG7u.111]
MTNPDNLILTKKQTSQKIKRIAFEIYESNFEEDEIVIAGINGTGYEIGKVLQEEFAKIAPVKCHLAQLIIDKKEPLKSKITLDCEMDLLSNKCIILVDDVLNTGRTFAYSLKPFQDITVKRIQVAVIVDRAYHRYPISADFVGYSLSTTVNERVEVRQEQDGFGVYLH